MTKKKISIISITWLLNECHCLADCITVVFVMLKIIIRVSFLLLVFFFFFIPATTVITSIFIGVVVTITAVPSPFIALTSSSLSSLGASHCSGPLVSFSLCLERAFSVWWLREKRGYKKKKGEGTGKKREIRVEAVIGDTQQEGCLLSLKEDKRERRRSEKEADWQEWKKRD